MEKYKREKRQAKPKKEKTMKLRRKNVDRKLQKEYIFFYKNTTKMTNKRTDCTDGENRR